MRFAPQLHVAVGVLTNSAGEVLIAQRHASRHLGGLWEFPGGKLEPGETAQQALRRELREELGIDVIATSPLIRVRYAYPDRRVHLDVFRVCEFTGVPVGSENQPIVWIAPERLKHFAFPPANLPIVTAARLPDYYAILDTGTDDRTNLLEQFDRISRLRVNLIQFRAHALDVEHYRHLASQVCQYGAEAGVSVLLNTDPDRPDLPPGAAGIHLTSKRLMQLRQRPLDKNYWVAASCHTIHELRQAERLGIDFVVLSPVLPTASHPEAEALGWPTFAELVAQVNLPVYALGGLARSDLETAQENGAQGIAGIRGFAG
jgi:8-oxo-dGTP diphosphatase